MPKEQSKKSSFAAIGTIDRALTLLGELGVELCHLQASIIDNPHQRKVVAEAIRGEQLATVEELRMVERDATITREQRDVAWFCCLAGIDYPGNQAIKKAMPAELGGWFFVPRGISCENTWRALRQLGIGTATPNKIPNIRQVWYDSVYRFLGADTYLRQDEQLHAITCEEGLYILARRAMANTGGLSFPLCCRSEYGDYHQPNEVCVAIPR